MGDAAPSRSAGNNSSINPPEHNGQVYSYTKLNCENEKKVIEQECVLLTGDTLNNSTLHL